jgi:hypothetical protein
VHSFVAVVFFASSFVLAAEFIKREGEMKESKEKRVRDLKIEGNVVFYNLEKKLKERGF